VEWIKLYGLLTGHLAEAEAFFDEQIAAVQAVETAESSGKKVAFFHFTPNGAVVVRRKADYVTRMIELAGGETAFTDLTEDDKALSTVTIQMESFYTQARDADVLIYNSTVAGELADLDALLAQNPLMADFKAVQTGNVWCTEQSMFQRSSSAAGMITDFHRILSGSDENLQFLHKLS
jgi:iron complex transport system substrate-binding protein